MVSHRFVLLTLPVLLLVGAAPPPLGPQPRLEDITNSLPRGPDGNQLRGKELFKEMNKKSYENNGKDIGEIDQIANYLAELNPKKESELKRQEEEVYAKNKEAIDNAKAEAAKLNPKKLPEGAELSFEQINSALGLDSILVEGDIEMSLDELKSHFGDATSASRFKRQAYHDSYFPQTIFQNGVYWYFDPALNTAARTAVQKAIAYYEQYTCIKFYQVSGPSGTSQTPVMRFFPGSGCYSPVGRKYWATEQAVSIGSGCESFGTAAHEIAHSLGIWHEQSRHDRNSYVYVDEAAIQSGRAHNFIMYNTTENYNYGLIYDYRGIMHYRANLFGINGTTVLYALNSLYQQAIGGTRKPIFTDILELNHHYMCMTKCSASGTTCYYGGYPNPNNCAVCICPTGFGGTNCQTRESPSSGLTCGATLSATSTWQTLTVSRQVGNGQWATTDLDNPAKCTWHIQGPSGSRVQWKVTHVGFSGDSYALCYDVCYFGGINVKGLEPSWRNEGIHYCCPSQLNAITTGRSALATVTAWNNYYYTDFTIEYKTA